MPKAAIRDNSCQRVVRTTSTLFRFVATLLFAGAINVAQSPQQGPAREEPLARVNVDLVQVDAIVTDSKGIHLTDLKPEDFEILESGKPQRITNFSFLSGERAVPAATQASSVAPARVTPQQVNRTMAAVVDDLGMSEHNFASVRRALDHLVDQQVGPGDLIAIVTTSGRLGTLQQLTADKRLLRAAVAKLRSVPNHRPGVQDYDFTCGGSITGGKRGRRRESRTKRRGWQGRSVADARQNWIRS